MMQKPQSELDKDIFRMICPMSAGMVGVCMTTIGLIRVIISLNKVNTLADDMLALDAVLFLMATLSSYFALRRHSVRRLPRLERFADLCFTCGMSLMVIVCLFVTYSIAI